MRILIVKLSSLGDVVHSMPAVQDMRAALPHAQIDWVVERAFAPLVVRCNGVGRVIPCEIRRWSKSPFSASTREQWAGFRADLDLQAYEAVIDLQGLTKSALIARLARVAPGVGDGKRYALANRTKGSGYEAPTRWVADVAVRVARHIHAVDRSRVLCAKALGYELPEAMSFGLKADRAELQPGPPRVAFVHGTSRADKEWPIDRWIALGKELNRAGFRIALPHGNAAEQARCGQIAAGVADAEVWPRMTLDALTDSLAACFGVIGVDSGLSHIAVALDLPHVQIYNFDTAWRTGPPPSSRQKAVFARPTPSLDQVWSAWLSVAADTRVAAGTSADAAAASAAPGQ
ncbi:MAG: lipopolysaccharide heptosyltransferase I [Burkholderiales bacterium]